MPSPTTKRSRSIVVFDSGIGGLNVAQALRSYRPHISMDFVADNCFFPYGKQPDHLLRKRIISLIGEAIERLSPQMVIIACNTASTLALDDLRECYPKQSFVGCIPPLRLAARESHSHVIGLLATPATIHRPYVSALQKTYAPNSTVITQASPNLASYAEQIFQGKTISAGKIYQEIKGLFEHPQSQKMDVIGIGCTHYSFFLNEFKKLTPHPLKWVDPAPAVARHAHHLLEKINLLKAQETDENCFWVTKNTPLTDSFKNKIAHYGFKKTALWSPLSYNDLSKT